MNISACNPHARASSLAFGMSKERDAYIKNLLEINAKYTDKDGFEKETKAIKPAKLVERGKGGLVAALPADAALIIKKGLNGTAVSQKEILKRFREGLMTL